MKQTRGPTKNLAIEVDVQKAVDQAGFSGLDRQRKLGLLRPERGWSRPFLVWWSISLLTPQSGNPWHRGGSGEIWAMWRDGEIVK